MSGSTRSTSEPTRPPNPSMRHGSWQSKTHSTVQDSTPNHSVSKFGILLSASEAVASTPVFNNDFGLVRAESAAFDGPSTPISSGDVEIRASITAKFAIAQPDCVNKAATYADKDTE